MYFWQGYGEWFFGSSALWQKGVYEDWGHQRNAIAKELGIEDYFGAGGIECNPYYTTKDADKKVSMAFRTLFSQEMIKNGVLMPALIFSYAHKQKELDRTLQVYKKALEEGVEKYLMGEVIKPVFRKYN